MKHVNRSFLLLLLAAGCIVYLYGHAIFLLASMHSDNDMMMNYLAAKMLNAKTTSYYSFDPSYIASHHPSSLMIPTLSPPFFVMLTASIARYISYEYFFLSLTLLSTLFNIIALIQLYLHFFSKDKNGCFLFILLNFVYFPTFMNITFGQVALLFNALIIFIFLSLQKNQPIRAGLLLAIAINIKLFFGIFFIYLLSKKSYRALLSFTLFTIGLAVWPLYVYGFVIYKKYCMVLNHIQWYSINWNASWYGFFSRLLGEKSHKFHSLFYAPHLAQWLYASTFLFYVFLIYYVAKKNKDPSLTFSFTLSSMLLISPLGWTYYFPILISSLLINDNHAKGKSDYTLTCCLLFICLFLSALPFPLYQKTNYSSLFLLFNGNVFFLALLLFNTTSLLLLFKKSNPIEKIAITPRVKKIILTICLFPSLIGLIGMYYFFESNKSVTSLSPTLAKPEDLLPSNLNKD